MLINPYLRRGEKPNLEFRKTESAMSNAHSAMSIT